MRKYYLLMALSVLFFIPCNSQGLFESAGDEDNSDMSYQLNGYVRGAYYSGELLNTTNWGTQSAFGEAMLKLNAKKGNLGEAFTEFRIRNGLEYETDFTAVDLREAYVSLYPGKFDIRLGKQIIAWGKADGMNPTNNITPQDIFIRSPDNDDTREGNFLLRTKYNLKPFDIEFIWVPTYKASNIPLEYINFANGLLIGEDDNPNHELDNSAFALKLNMVKNDYDASLSYFNGYNPYQGMRSEVTAINQDSILVYLHKVAYRMHILGGDFSTTLGSYGLRGEIAYRYPFEDYEKKLHVPNPDLQYILGVDHDFGKFDIVLQYVGRYVQDFKELPDPNTLPPDDDSYYIELHNRIFATQLNEFSHSISARGNLDLLYETLEIELLSMYNFTTNEVLLKPRITYDIYDALSFSLGADYYYGDENTMFEITSPLLNCIFVQLKTSF